MLHTTIYKMHMCLSQTAIYLLLYLAERLFCDYTSVAFRI
jgi:hypothetical protein